MASEETDINEHFEVRCYACNKWVKITEALREHNVTYCNICIKGADNIPSGKEMNKYDKKV